LYGSTFRFTRLDSICRDCLTLSFSLTCIHPYRLPTVQDISSSQSSLSSFSLLYTPLFYTPLFSTLYTPHFSTSLFSTPLYFYSHSVLVLFSMLHSSPLIFTPLFSSCLFSTLLHFFILHSSSFLYSSPLLYIPMFSISLTPLSSTVLQYTHVIHFTPIFSTYTPFSFSTSRNFSLLHFSVLHFYTIL
jgi:hypothetical protein